MFSIERFCRDERGAALTTEFVLWVPVVMALLLVVIDATTIYITHTEMTNVARDTARRMVMNNLTTEGAARSYAASALNLRDAYTYDVDIHYEKNERAEVIIRFAVADMSILGYTSPMRLFGGIMSARVIMRPAPNTEFGESA